MRILKKVRKFPCVYWAPPINNGKSIVFPLPVECKCRWEDEHEEIRSKDGTTFVSDSVVMMDRLTVVGGYLFRGSLAEMKQKFGNSVDPREIVEAKMIQHILTVPTLRAKNYENMKNLAHWAYL